MITYVIELVNILKWTAVRRRKGWSLWTGDSQVPIAMRTIVTTGNSDFSEMKQCLVNLDIRTGEGKDSVECRLQEFYQLFREVEKIKNYMDISQGTIQ